MLKKIKVFFIFIFPLVAIGQTLPYHSDIVLFQDCKSKQPIVISQDSIMFKGNHLKKQKFSHTPYLGKIHHYLSFHLSGKTYLAHNGCGCMLEYRNDSIVRIDHSFLHMNQIGASTFQYKNTLYYFGGYGLFTFKNILTKYNFVTNEWDRVKTFGPELPSARSQAYSQLIGDDLYVFGGHGEEETSINERREVVPEIWVLHLNSLEWEKIGAYDTELNINFENHPFIANGKLYAIVEDGDAFLIEFDLKNNRVKKYKSKVFVSMSHPYFDSSTNQLVFINNQKTNEKSVLTRLKIKDMEGELILDEKFIHSIIPIWYYLLPVLLLISWIIIKYRKSLLSKVIPFDGMVYKKSTRQFIYNGKTVNFDTNESKLLTFLFHQINHFTPLISLNEIFENGVEESFTAVTKRRESAYGSLVSKLTTLFDAAENELILQQKNPKDKRIKEIKLSSGYFKIK